MSCTLIIAVGIIWVIISLSSDNHNIAIKINQVGQLVFSPNGKFLAVRTSNDIQLWNTVEPHLVRTFGRERAEGIWDIAWSSDSEYLATARYFGLVDVWQVNNGNLISSLKGPYDAIYHIWFDKTRNPLVALGSKQVIKLWSPNSNNLIITLDGDPQRLAFSLYGELIAAPIMISAVGIWSVDGTLVKRFDLEVAGGIAAIAFSPDREFLGVGTASGAIEILKIRDGTVVQILNGFSEPIGQLEFSSNGELIAACAASSLPGAEVPVKDTSIRLWRVSDGTIVKKLEGHTAQVLSLSFNPDNQLLASSSFDETIRLWPLT